MKRIVKEKRSGDIDTLRDYEYTSWENVRRFSEDFLEELSGNQGQSS
jgi:menaquinone-dependent protoporphyrinogen IX oxidase